MSGDVKVPNVARSTSDVVMHPEYGNLETLLATIGRDVRDGRYLRRVHVDALDRFADEFVTLRMNASQRPARGRAS